MAVLENDVLVGPLTPAAGVTTISLDFDGTGWQASWLEVYKSGSETPLVLGTDYTVAGAGTVSAVVTLLTPATGTDTYSVYLVTPLERSSDMQLRGEFKSEPFNVEMDRIWQRLQYHNTVQNRSLQLGRTSLATGVVVAEAGSVVGFNEDLEVTVFPRNEAVSVDNTSDAFAFIGQTASDILENTSMGYSAGATVPIAEGDVLLAADGKHIYVVAASDATDAHWATPGGVKLYVRPESKGYNILAFGAVADFDDSDPTGETGTNNRTAIVTALATGGDVYVPRGSFRVDSQINLTVDGQNIVGDGWFSSRIYYTGAETAGARLFYVDNENIGFSQIGLFNGINVGTPRDRRNVLIEQSAVHGNLNLDTVYMTGAGYGVICNGAFAHRLTIENTKEAAFWAKQGGKTSIVLATFSGNKTAIRLGNGTTNANCLDMSFSNIVMEFGTDFQWALDHPAAIDIQGKASKTSWSNIRILKAYGPSIKIDNEYDESGTLTPAESNHVFSNIQIRQNKSDTIDQHAVYVRKSKNVLIENLDTHQAVLAGGGNGYSSAVYVADTDSFVRVSNSAVGGTNESIINDSFQGSTSQIYVSNTEYKKGGTTYKAGQTRVDTHLNDLGNKTGNVNLTIGYGSLHKMTLTGNITMTSIVNYQSDGICIELMFVQDGTGGHTVSFNTGKWVASLPAASGTAGQRCTAKFVYDASISKFVQIGAASPWM